MSQVATESMKHLNSLHESIAECALHLCVAIVTRLLPESTVRDAPWFRRGAMYFSRVSE